MFLVKAKNRIYLILFLCSAEVNKVIKKHYHAFTSLPFIFPSISTKYKPVKLYVKTWITSLIYLRFCVSAVKNCFLRIHKWYFKPGVSISNPPTVRIKAMEDVPRATHWSENGFADSSSEKKALKSQIWHCYFIYMAKLTTLKSYFIIFRGKRAT